MLEKNLELNEINRPSSVAPDRDALLTVYFDGACHLCSREIDHYKTLPRSELIQWKDIADPHFDAPKEGREFADFHRSMHVKRRDGQFLQGVDAFLEIWKVLGRFAWLSRLVTSSWGRPVFDLGYFAFARIRVYLPKRKRDQCEDGRCSVG